MARVAIVIFLCDEVFLLKKLHMILESCFRYFIFILSQTSYFLIFLTVS